MIQRPSSQDPHSPNRAQMQQIASAILYGVLVVLALWVVHNFIPAVVWAAVIAIALWPAMRAIEAHRLFKGRTTLISIVLTTAVGLLVVLPIGLGITQAAREAHDLIVWTRTIQENGVPLPAFVEHLPFGAQQISAWWQANLAQPLNASPAMKGLHGQAVVTFGRHFGARAAHGLLVFGFTLVTLFVIFQAGPRLSGALLKGARRAFGADGAQILQRMAGAVRGTVTGLVVVGLGEGALLGVAYAIAGVPHATLLALVTAVAAMLPFCAPIVFGGAALWLFAVQGAVAGAIGVAAFGVVVVFVAEHFVRPVLIGNSTRLPFLLVLFGILGGAETFGLLGLFIGPALMTVLVVLWKDWVQ
ncbi:MULTISPECIES: AI-2E family transporter [Paraburkholderia]|uniref:AI-2E family transporter n=1 Tax=Paraburkholderia TaxID=1822464 RepID=UPI00225386BC|nr:MULTISPECIES: AI-2E family transporter [Paraburkholderia]MCX4165106.1 AI-2E family transporter [Paraburkholderia megapolitana]MDN7160599.1 AI-2E family transporter [Paraburkholderia sp. CHISQ3]MDQ6497646.1 AI-2E family transporter [Paraburkholderia megapolitana]